MSATTSGAVKALIESMGLGVAVYRDRQPENERLPYVIVHEAITLEPDPAFNPLDDPDRHVIEEVQIDLWERWRSQTEETESYTLGEHLALGLTAAAFTDPPAPVIAVRLIDGPIRLVQNEENLVHKIFRLRVHRLLVPLGS